MIKPSITALAFGLVLLITPAMAEMPYDFVAALPAVSLAQEEFSPFARPTPMQRLLRQQQAQQEAQERYQQPQWDQQNMLRQLQNQQVMQKQLWAPTLPTICGIAGDCSSQPKPYDQYPTSEIICTVYHGVTECHDAPPMGAETEVGAGAEVGVVLAGKTFCYQRK